MMKPVPLLLCASIAVLAGCAAPPSAPGSQLAESRGPQCFRVNEVTGYTQAEDGFVNLQTASGPFRVHLDPGCPDFSWIMQIGMRPMDSSWLCNGDHLEEIITAYQSPNSRCFISDIEALTPDAMAALPLTPRPEPRPAFVPG